MTNNKYRYDKDSTVNTESLGNGEENYSIFFGFECISDIHICDNGKLAKIC